MQRYSVYYGAPCERFLRWRLKKQPLMPQNPLLNLVSKHYVTEKDDCRDPTAICCSIFPWRLNGGKWAAVPCAGPVLPFQMIKDSGCLHLSSGPQQISHSSFNVLHKSTKETCSALWDQQNNSSIFGFLLKRSGLQSTRIMAISMIPFHFSLNFINPAAYLKIFMLTYSGLMQPLFITCGSSTSI